MSATEVAADLRDAARGLRMAVRDGVTEETSGPELLDAGSVIRRCDRLEALADSFDQEGQLGFDRATGEMVALEPPENGSNRFDSWSIDGRLWREFDPPRPLWRFPSVSAQEEPR